MWRTGDLQGRRHHAPPLVGVWGDIMGDAMTIPKKAVIDHGHHGHHRHQDVLQPDRYAIDCSFPSRNLLAKTQRPNYECHLDPIPRNDQIECAIPPRTRRGVSRFSKNIDSIIG